MQALLTTSELAKLLNLSAQTIYNRRSSGSKESLPPCIRLSGNIIRYRLPDVEQWLLNMAPLSTDAYEQEKEQARPKRKGRPTKEAQIKRRLMASIPKQPRHPGTTA